MDLKTLSDDELTDKLKALVVGECGVLGDVIAHLGEFDRRYLHEKKGHGNIYVYCTLVLGFSEDAAYKRIVVAKAARQYPSILNRLTQGRITLTAVALLSRHLSSDNHRHLLDWACGKNRREIEKKIAALAPQSRPATTDVVRHLGPKPPCSPAALEAPSLFELPPLPSAPATETPQTEAAGSQRVRFAFTADEALLLKLDRAKEVLKHKHPAGHLEDIFGEALEVLLERKDPDRKWRRKASLRRTHSWRQALEDRRRIPQAVKDEVWERDSGSCVFTAQDGTRCGQRAGLEFDHIVPFALGGPSHDPKNIRLLCRAHNQMLARRIFGAAAVKGKMTKVLE